MVIPVVSMKDGKPSINSSYDVLMAPATDYKIFITTISAYLSDGWILHGDLIALPWGKDIIFIQAVVKPVIDKKSYTRRVRASS